MDAAAGTGVVDQIIAGLASRAGVSCAERTFLELATTDQALLALREVSVLTLSTALGGAV